MVVSDKVKKYIKECKDLIEEDNWVKIYDNMCPHLSPFQIGEFTSIMLDCGINPLLHMYRIPSFYLYNVKKVKEFKIPDHINTIGMSAFDMSGIEKIHIPSSINVIWEGAFRLCNLKEIYLEDLPQFTSVDFRGIWSNPFFCNPECKIEGYLNGVSFTDLRISYNMPELSLTGDRDENITFYGNMRNDIPELVEIENGRGSLYIK